MKYLFSIGLIIGLFSIILFSGCVSNKQRDLTDGNWMNQQKNDLLDDAIDESIEQVNETNTEIELKDNEIKHCVCHLMEIQYDYWIAKEELARETTFGGKVKNIINKIESCAIMDNIPKQCVPVNEAGGFEELKTAFLQETETMTCNCDIIEYNSKYFN
jgi:hypothetical protein